MDSPWEAGKMGKTPFFLLHLQVLMNKIKATRIFGNPNFGDFFFHVLGQPALVPFPGEGNTILEFSPTQKWCTPYNNTQKNWMVFPGGNII
ncbi:MAG: hypothetical protein ACYCOO_10850 [Chitinophagaceae bacterium]